ncbi:hypothetical protein E2C01_062785 [Portunus trituberculatus]|uniref:Uncharacterized protein n=1 Tax=Portunus trituberculatus TaxID=210409 RepID=A0A5B7HEP1_PORTR|nr:hypothetical protein [Portunus trituberculatus]
MMSGDKDVKSLEGELRRAEDTLTEMKTSTQELFDQLQCDAQPIVAIRYVSLKLSGNTDILNMG